MTLPMENTEKMIFSGVGKYGIPEIKPETDIRIDKLEWIPVNYALTAKDKATKGVHFYKDDYQFERFWNNPNFAGAKNYTFEGLKKSWVATQAVEERISKAVVLHDIDAYPKPEFTSKQTTFARDIILKELGVDNPKWEKRRK